jgi:hypothetical protein
MLLLLLLLLLLLYCCIKISGGPGNCSPTDDDHLDSPVDALDTPARMTMDAPVDALEDAPMQMPLDAPEEDSLTGHTTTVCLPPASFRQCGASVRAPLGERG